MDTLPFVSILTPTYNKRGFFPLAINNFLSFDYPPEKLEWIIVDDGPDSIKDILPPGDSRIKYYYYNAKAVDELYGKFIESYRKKKAEYKALGSKDKKGQKYKLRPEHKNGAFKGGRIPLGLKRNLCAQYAAHNILIHMDDDDFYPIKSVLERVVALGTNECVGCSSIAGFHINKFISFVYKPEINYSPARKISPATLGYTRDFWRAQKFENQDIMGEGEHFLRKRQCVDLHWKNIIVALYHRRNEMLRNAFQGEANGWGFYPISNELFLLITSCDGEGDENKANKTEKST